MLARGTLAQTVPQSRAFATQKGPLDKFVKVNPNNKTENIARDLVTEEQINPIKPEKLDQTHHKNDNENIFNYNEICNTPPFNI